MAFKFEKVQENPLRISYIQNYSSHLQVNIFKEGDLYKGVFVIGRLTETYYSLGYFESSNGTDWQMKKEILNTGDDLSNPSILKTSNGYLLFITRFDNKKKYKIYSIDCNQNFNCSSTFVPVINPDVGNAMNNMGVFAGHPFQQENRTFLFYGSWDYDNFKLRLAYSDDLVNWQQCPNAFLYGGDGPFPYKENNDFYLFFHRSDNTGIKIAKSSLPLSCDSIFEDQGYLLVRDKYYDARHLIFPSVIYENNRLSLYYSGKGLDSNWYFNLAKSCAGQTCLTPSPTILVPTLTNTPTPTLIPTLTLTPTLTPVLTPTDSPVLEKRPIIIIPGFLASWNRDAILHNKFEPQSEWKLNPIVSEYDGLIKTLINLGYEENKNLFIFAYDWRKPILSIVEDLNTYVSKLVIDRKQLFTNYQIIGHSLGGLIGRIYKQKYNDANINKIITAGSPHYGVSQSYKIVEAGEIERFNNYLWLSVKLILTINKNNFETDKQTINRLFPVIKDLFPVYNFIKKDGKEIHSSSMKIKNETLITYSSNLTDNFYKTNFKTIIGEKGQTLKGFNVTDQTFFDKIFDDYVDGRPQSSIFEMGDYTVLSSSAKINIPEVLSLEHGELIYKKEGIKKILNLLNIKYKDPQIIEGKGTVIDSSILFLIKSPATLEVIFNGKSYFEKDGIIFIENAQSGNYKIKIIGKEVGISSSSWANGKKF